MKGLHWVWAFLVVLGVGISDVRSEQVVFSEIMYHPPDGMPEYIELYNNTATPFDIAEWRLSDGVEYVFPSFSVEATDRTFLKPFERILLSPVDEETLRAAYGVPATVRVYGPWTGSLKNSGERITLKDKNGATVCTVEYNDRGRWSPAADGAGHTLVLKNPDRKIDDWRNWTASGRLGGTPGAEEPKSAETPVDNPEVNLVTGIPYVNYGDVWKYNDKNVDLGTAWRAPAFDDSAWPQGPGLFGFETASLPSPGIRTSFERSQQLTYYLRTKFNYTGATKGVTLTIDQILDDGAVYYLNGHELGRSGVGPGDVTFATAANRTTGDAVEELAVITTDGSALVNGVNVLAVEVHQTNTTSSDVVFGMRLNVSAPSQASLLINEVLPGLAGVGFVEIYNPGAAAINLRDHYLTDDPTNLRKYRFTSDVVIPPGGLATVGYAEAGLVVTSPLRLCLVAPDGSTIINLISSEVPLDGRSLGRKPTGGDTWFFFTEPTRGMPNVSQSAIALQIHLNEVHFSGSRAVDWVELYNSSDEPISLDGLFLSSKADLSNRTPLRGSVPAGGYVSQEVAFSVSDGRITLFLVNSAGAVLSAKALDRPLLGDSCQAFPEGSSEWYASAQSSRNAANDPARNTNVVINEILYHPPSDEPSGEYVELCNRGEAAVDVSGWRFVEGIDFAIPAGTVIPAKGYLAVAADANWIRAAYGDIPVVGDFDGRLSNQGEVVRLVDQWGNLVDEVDYLTGGNWPGLADGGGSSMELQNPWMDNSRSSAWLASDESAKAPFEHYSYSDVYRQLNTLGSPTDYKELHLHLVGDSHVILKNIQVRLNRSGPNLIANGNRMSTDGRSANGWLAQGTHYASYLSGDELHLISDGHGDNRPNRVEIDVTAMQFRRAVGFRHVAPHRADVGPQHRHQRLASGAGEHRDAGRAELLLRCGARPAGGRADAPSRGPRSRPERSGDRPRPLRRAHATGPSVSPPGQQLGQRDLDEQAHVRRRRFRRRREGRRRHLHRATDRVRPERSDRAVLRSGRADERPDLPAAQGGDRQAGDVRRRHDHQPRRPAANAVRRLRRGFERHLQRRRLLAAVRLRVPAPVQPLLQRDDHRQRIGRPLRMRDSAGRQPLDP